MSKKMLEKTDGSRNKRKISLCCGVHQGLLIKRPYAAMEQIAGIASFRKEVTDRLFCPTSAGNQPYFARLLDYIDRRRRAVLE